MVPTQGWDVLILKGRTKPRSGLGPTLKTQGIGGVWTILKDKKHTYIRKMNPTLPDLRNSDPSRRDINEDTVVVNDLADTFIEFNKNVARFEDSLMSRYASTSISDLDELIRRAQYMRKRLTNERAAVNKAFRPRS